MAVRTDYLALGDFPRNTFFAQSFLYCLGDREVFGTHMIELQHHQVCDATVLTTHLQGFDHQPPKFLHAFSASRPVASLLAGGPSSVPLDARLRGTFLTSGLTTIPNGATPIELVKIFDLATTAAQLGSHDFLEALIGFEPT